MYLPRPFKVDDPARMQALIQHNPLSLIIVSVDDEAQANSVPMLLDPDVGAHGQLRFHLAAGNPLVKWLDGERSALVVFSGDEHYISPDWYAAEQLVPTWNYSMVQTRGIPQLLDDTQLVTLLGDLSAVHEEKLKPKKPWTNDKLEPQHFARLRQGIRGYQMPIESIQGKWKMSQNRGEDDRQGAIDALEQLPDNPGAIALAATMRKS